MLNYPTTDSPIDREDQRKLTQELLADIEAKSFQADTGVLPFRALEFYGIEGIGKTRILNVVKEICEKRQLPFITIESSFNWQDAEDQSALVSEFLRSVCEQIGRRSEMAGLAASASTVLENIQRMRDTGVAEYGALIKEFIGVLVEIQTKIHHPLILLLDKTEYCPAELLNWIGTDFARLFVEADRSPGMAIIFAGRGQLIRESRWPNYFKQASGAYMLNPLSIEFTEHHIGSLPSGTRYQSATEFIYDLSNGHPYSTEMIVFELSKLGVEVDAVEQHRLQLAEKLYEEVIRKHILEDAKDWVRKFVEIASIPRWFKPDLLKKLFSGIPNLPEEFRADADATWFTYKAMDLRKSPWNLVIVTRDAYEIERPLRKLMQKALSILHPQDTIQLHQKVRDIYQSLDSLEASVVLEILFHVATISLLTRRDVFTAVKDELSGQLKRFSPKHESEMQEAVQLKLSLLQDVELIELLGGRPVEQLAQLIDEHLRRPSENINVISEFFAPSEYRVTWFPGSQMIWPTRRIYTNQRYGWNEWRTQMPDTGHSAFAAYLPREAQDFLLNHEDVPLQLVTNYSDIPWELFHDGVDFLSLRHAMARKPQMFDTPVVHPRFPEGSKYALVVGNPTGDLPEAEREANEVAALFKKHGWDVETLIGDEATVNAFALKLRNRPYRLIHFAGHARYDVDVPLKSSLKFKDYSWLAEEFERQLSSQAFLYLNACETAQTYTESSLRNPRGEFMEGVAISTLKGGAMGCLGPLWAIRDDLARGFALEFYKHALSGETLGESVRLARLAFRKKSPDFWAGWVLYGDPTYHLYK
ncbi:MAG: CHAT domain-containing protein [Anaerolineales bacterium]|nr:CHAT domain-containing protein [Anaerolineales bacterium]